MEAAPERTAHGRITVVEEERFRLVTDSGQGLLLTLANHSPTQVADLHRLQEENAHVAVLFQGEPNLASGVAYAVQAT